LHREKEGILPKRRKLSVCITSLSLAVAVKYKCEESGHVLEISYGGTV
jgi:hypothetical protein